MSNLIVIPLAWLLMYFGIFMLLLSALFTPPFWLVAIFQFLLKGMTKSVHIVENLPHSVINGLHFTRFDLLLITLLVFFLADALWKKKKWALYSSLIIATFLSLKYSVEALEKKAAREITFYSIPQKTALEIRAGREVVLLADSTLLQDEDAMLFFIRHNLWAGSILKTEEFYREQNSISNLHNYKNGVLEVFDKRILFYQNSSDSLKFSLKPTHIFVASRAFPPHKLPTNCVVILQTGMKPKTAAAWRSGTKNVYELSVDGALVLKED